MACVCIYGYPMNVSGWASKELPYYCLELWPGCLFLNSNLKRPAIHMTTIFQGFYWVLLIHINNLWHGIQVSSYALVVY